MRSEFDAGGLEPALAVEMAAAFATVGVGLEPEVGDEQVHVGDGRRAVLEVLDGLEPTHQLLVEGLGHVVRARQSRGVVMTHQALPVALQEVNRLPLARGEFWAVPTPQVSEQLERDRLRERVGGQTRV